MPCGVKEIQKLLVANSSRKQGRPINGAIICGKHFQPGCLQWDRSAKKNILPAFAGRMPESPFYID